MHAIQAYLQSGVTSTLDASYRQFEAPNRQVEFHFIIVVNYGDVKNDLAMIFKKIPDQLGSAVW